MIDPRRLLDPRPWLALIATAGLAASAPPASFRNPVIDRDFPDPATLRVGGDVYVYATQGNGHNIQVARSRDLVRWEDLPDALPVKPDWAGKTQDFWAPHVEAHGGRYFLYYSAKPDAALTDTKQGLCLAVATAARPEGPFTDSGRPLQCGEGFVNIDPMAYDDPASGKRLLYWGSGFGPIKVRELAPDRVTFAAGSAPVDLVQPVKDEDPRNYRRLIEGAWVLRRGGWYYLFFSGDNCCGAKAHYAVMVARSRQATGPFVVRDDARAPGGVILAARGRWVAPGHNAVITDDRGRDWLVYHAVDARRPRTRPADDVNSRRVMLIDRLVWRDGWPDVAGGGPSEAGGTAPVLRSPRPARR
jgi:arabinan endo-1,5-alpha-L-arabinosidase